MKTVIVIGSGVMGRGIAYVSAVGGFDTMIIDVNKQVLENAKNEITMIFNKSVSRGKLTQQHAEEAQSRLLINQLRRCSEKGRPNYRGCT